MTENSIDSESQHFLAELEQKYKNEQLALLGALIEKWQYYENPQEVRHSISYWHGLDQNQFEQVFSDFIILAKTHAKESYDNFEENP